MRKILCAIALMTFLASCGAVFVGCGNESNCSSPHHQGPVLLAPTTDDISGSDNDAIC